MEWEGDIFLVCIDGSKETEDGADNHQYKEIAEVLENVLEDITSLSSEEVIPVYGVVKVFESTKERRNGLVALYFDGEKLAEIFTASYEKSAVAVSYINQEIRDIDVEEIRKATGIAHLLFVDYDSKAHYKTITQP